MNLDSVKQWNEVIRLSHKMRDLAEKEQWEDLAKIEKNRDQLIKLFFSISIEPGDSKTVAAGIEEILLLDNTVIDICRKRKEKVGAQLKQFRSSRRAKNAYLQNSA